MPYKAIIFDFFDVILADPYHAWLNNHGLANEGAQAEANNAVDLDNISKQEFYAELGKVTDQTAAEVEAEQLDASRLDPEVVAIAGRLKQHYALALISNSSSVHIRSLLALHNLEGLFDHIVISGETGYTKPDPRIFKDALTGLNVLPEESIFIDDNPANVQAAEKLGITGIRFTGAKNLTHALVRLGINVSA